ncbi:hypothetical protein, partial [Comamonas jiangduensis]|uniref:hypothetical protein n=1 Tax=Comamonas jiangduensis TaxID=1194168 RepID=UPI003524159A
GVPVVAQCGVFKAPVSFPVPDDVGSPYLPHSMRSRGRCVACKGNHECPSVIPTTFPAFANVFVGELFDLLN